MYMYMHVYKSVWMFQFAVGIDPFQRGTQDLLSGAVVMDPSSALAKPPETESPRTREQRLSFDPGNMGMEWDFMGIRGYYLYIYKIHIYIYIHLRIQVCIYMFVYVYTCMCSYMIIHTHIVMMVMAKIQATVIYIYI